MRQRRDNFELWAVSSRAILLLVSLAFLPLQAQESPTREKKSAQSDFKVAVVDIQSLFRSYRKTLMAEREIDLARAEIQKQSQLATNEIQTRKRIVEKRVFEIRKGEASEAEIADFQRELPILNRELKIAEEEKQTERNLANQKLNQQMVRRMEGILDEIVELTAAKADAEGFDLVVDSSGTNSNQVAPLLFIKDAIDLTEMMKKELSKPASGSR